MIKLSFSTSEFTSENRGRELLPAAKIFGRRYRCCHTDQPRHWLLLELKSNSQATHRRSCELAHPRCCQQGWAVAVFQLALRRGLRELAGGKPPEFFSVAEDISQTLLHYFPAPGADDYWQLVRELSFERSQRLRERAAAEARWVAAREFIAGGNSIRLPACLVRLGFDTCPESTSAIKQRYYSLSHAFHPDHGGSSAQFRRLEADVRSAIAWWHRHRKKIEE